MVNICLPIYKVVRANLRRNATPVVNVAVHFRTRK